MWDCLDQAVTEMEVHNNFLTNTCSKYIRFAMERMIRYLIINWKTIHLRERGDVEKEYARNLRRLSHKYGGSPTSPQDKLEDQPQIVQLFK